MHPIINTNENSENNSYELTAFNLKLFAMITMFIDHIGAIIIEKYIVLNPNTSFWGLSTELSINILKTFDAILRSIGRVAFPIFCFFIAQGAIYTSNRLKYFLRLLLLAIIAEIPFNFALNNTMAYPRVQSTIFTLLLGLLAIYSRDYVASFEGLYSRIRILRYAFLFLDGILLFPILCSNNYIYNCFLKPTGYKITASYNILGKNITFYNRLFFVLALIFAMLFTIAISVITRIKSAEQITNIAVGWIIPLFLMFIANFFGTDYGAAGVLAIYIMYILMTKKESYETTLFIAILCLAAFNVAELIAITDSVLIRYYKGTKGKGNKYLFYIFYVSHLLFLGIIAHFFVYR